MCHELAQGLLLNIIEGLLHPQSEVSNYDLSSEKSCLKPFNGAHLPGDIS